LSRKARWIVEWNLADAKNRFSEVVDRAMTEGPQHVRRRGEAAVVVIAEGDYERMKGKRPSFKEFLLRGPGVSLEGVDLNRDRSPGRDFEW
jgi:antitoxin Phd